MLFLPVIFPRDCAGRLYPWTKGPCFSPGGPLSTALCFQGLGVVTTWLLEAPGHGTAFVIILSLPLDSLIAPLVNPLFGSLSQQVVA